MTHVRVETLPPGFDVPDPDLLNTIPMDDVVGGAAAFAAIFGILFAAVVIFIIYSAVKNYRLAKSRGYDPVTMQTDMATRLMDSPLVRPSAAGPAATDGNPGTKEPAAGISTLEERLAEIDSLHERGLITADERATARARILGG